MNAESFSFRLQCSRCEWQVRCGPPEMLTRLQHLGMLKRAAEPESEILVELFTSSAIRFRCDECGQVGLLAQSADDDDDNWPEARQCEVCRTPIPLERLEVLPDATRCTQCQDADSQVNADEELEYCPRCGAIMKMRQKQVGGITRYVMACGECGR